VDLLAMMWTAITGAWWILPLLLFPLFLRSRWGKGVIGESLVRVMASSGLPSDTYHRFHNLLLPTPDGTTQVDHVIVSKYGIFVIETKNLQGWIFGQANQAMWTQNIYGKKTRFQNPLRQNYKHVLAVASSLEVPESTVHSIIAFEGTAEFKTEMPANVTVGNGFLHHIRSFTTQVFSDAEVAAMAGRLQAVRRNTRLADQRAHVRSLNDRSDETQEQRCPRCGEPLVVRTASRGERAGQRFWGCSSYPKCKYTRQIAA